MKIDTSTVTLSTDARYTEKNTAERSRQIRYWDLDDENQKIVAENTTYQEVEMNVDQKWYETETVNNKTYKQELEESQTVYTRYFEQSEIRHDMLDSLKQMQGELGEQSKSQLSERAVRMLDLADKQLKFITVDSEGNPLESAEAVQESSAPGASQNEPVGSIVEEIEKMAGLLENVLDELNTLNKEFVSPLDHNFANKFHPRLNMTNIDWVNVNPAPNGPDDATAYGYAIHDEIKLDHYEREQVDFFGEGIVKTADGESIDFSFEMNLDREFFREETYVEKETGFYFVDPLVINLNGTIPRLSEAKFSLDLDLDGEAEELTGLMPGSGFLCLDKNNDGIINDGSELFGPSTGDGFYELIQYDKDQNLWIDENDEIFDELAFWENDGQGGMQLTKIKDAGIGAIYLSSSSTPFDLMDDDNQLQARITDSGIALNEDGSVSSVQEIHWAV